MGILSSALASGHAIIRRRDPRAALWWTAASWFFPFVGPLLYYFLGINRIERKVLRLRSRTKPSAPAVSGNGEDPRTSSLGHLSSLAHLVKGVVRKPLTNGNKVTPLINGDAAYPAMLQAIDEATSSVGLSTYIFENDRVGQLFIAALARAAKRNVAVRVLIDDVGAGFSWRSVDRSLSRNNVKVAYFHPTLVPWRMAYINLRNHRKILTVDGRIGFTGGINIADGHMISLKPASPCEDLHFRLEGPVVSHLQDTFRSDWYFATGENLDGDFWFPQLKKAGATVARGIQGGPAENFEKCRWTILGALSHAEKSIRIATPYLIPDLGLITALNLAAMSGVRVDIVLPEKNDLALVHWASQAMLWQVLERGCRVWRTPPPFNHSKLMSVDGLWSLFGSSNWDTRSLRLNFEFDVECYDKGLAGQLESLLDERIAKAREITLSEVDSRSIPIKLRDGIARLFAPHL